VAEFLDGAPCGEAGVARLALDTVRVVAGVLVKRNSTGKVVGADDIATATAVVFAEVPCEVGLADGTCFGRLIRLPVCHGGWSSNLAVFFVDTLAGGSAKA